MNSLLSAPVLSAASVLPVSAGIHDFNEQNARPSVSPSANGRCITMTDKSHLCYQKFDNIYTIAINDIDYPRIAQSVVMNCSTGKWTAFGGLTKQTLNLYMNDFCSQVSR